MKDGKGRHSGEVLPNTGEIKDQSTLMIAKKKKQTWHVLSSIIRKKKVKIKTKQNKTLGEFWEPLEVNSSKLLLATFWKESSFYLHSWKAEVKK